MLYQLSYFRKICDFALILAAPRNRKKTFSSLGLHKISAMLRIVGGGGLEPPNPKERIYSPPQLPLCDPPKFL